MTNWKQIREEFESEDITLKALAEKYNIKTSTMRSRKNREDWQRNVEQNVATRRNATGKKGGQLNNKNSVGNQGGPPTGNKNAVTHGLFAKYLPEEAQEIMNELIQSEPSDIIWNNIMIQYTAIIRAQKIMFVNNQNDLSKETSGYSDGVSYSESYAVQYAWDKQANFLAAQSRAMATLSNLIRQFILISDEADERRLKLDSMRLSVDKTQAEIRRLSIQNGDVGPEEMPDDGFMDAIKNIANDEEVWNDDNIET